LGSTPSSAISSFRLGLHIQDWVSVCSGGLTTVVVGCTLLELVVTLVFDVVLVLEDDRVDLGGSLSGSLEKDRAELIVDVPVWSPGCFQGMSLLYLLVV